MTNIDALAALVGRIDLNPGLPNIGRLWVGRESLEPLAAHETAARRDKYAVVDLVREAAGCSSTRFHRGKIAGFDNPLREEIMYRVHTPVQTFMPSPMHPEGAVLAAEVAKANAAHIDIAAATQVTGRATVVVATDAVRPVLFTSDRDGAVNAPSEYWEEVSDPAAFIAAVQARGNAALQPVLGREVARRYTGDENRVVPEGTPSGRVYEVAAYPVSARPLFDWALDSIHR